MAHFAKLDQNNVVIEVCVVNNSVISINNEEFEEEGIKFLSAITGHQHWKQTSYSSKFRKNYASPGYSYDEELDVFLPPKPFNSWILDETTYQWTPPVSYPDDGYEYVWIDSALKWVKLG